MPCRDYATAALYYIQHSAKRAAADRTTRDYLDRMNERSCLDEIYIALTSAFTGDDYLTNDVFRHFAVNVDNRPHAVWTHDSFTQYLETRPSGILTSLAPSLVPLLWALFTAAADFPLAPPITLSPADRSIDQAGFRRASAFLVLRGFELLGARKDGTPYAWDRVETGYKPKLNRLARITFCSLRWIRHIKTNAPSIPDDSATEDLMEQNAIDGISFAQPIVYHGFPSPKGDDRGLDPKFYEAAARQLSDAGRRRLEQSGHILATGISLGDLRTLVKLLVVNLSVDQQRWRDGLVMPSKYLFQRSGDVYYARLTSVAPEDAAIISASSVIDDLLSIWFPDASGEHIAWPTFEKWFTDNPMFIFLYFELWAAIFEPSREFATQIVRPSGNLFPSSLANLLSLLGVVTFLSATGPIYRFHMNEHFLLQALRTATCVLSLPHPLPSRGGELHKTLTSGDWFHILVVRSEDLEPLISQESVEMHSFVVFVQPAGAGVEMWLPDDDGIPVVEFVWRRPIVQLEPKVLLSAGPGLVCTLYDEQTTTLTLQTPETANEQRSENGGQNMELAFDFNRGVLSCSDFTGVPSRLRILQVDCYRLAEEASFIRPSKVKDSINFAREQ